MATYLPRIVDKLIDRRLLSIGAIVLEGPRATGKTMTGTQHASSTVRVDQELERQPFIREQPSLIVPGKTPRLIDEWQVLPELWNIIRREVDNRQLVGQFILTGSAIPQDDVTRHSGAGRFSRIKMRPMTLVESGISTGDIGLGDLLSGVLSVSGRSSLTIHDTIDLVMTGGWPGNRTGGVSERSRWVRDYVEETTRVDLATLGTSGRSRDPGKISRFLRSLARNIGAATKLSTLVQDTEVEAGRLSRETIESYMESLRRVMVLEEVPAWQPHLRSSTQLRTRPKHYFVDPSIGPATMKTTSSKLLKDLNYVGQLFENLVMRDIQVYAQAHNCSIAYYRDNNGLEVDMIIEGEMNEWIAVEVKLGQTYIDEAAGNLLRFKSKVDAGRMGTPKACVVITSGGYAYTRLDGVHVIPIDLLGP